MNEEKVIKYLKWVIEEYGPEKHILQTNCTGKPERPEDYCVDHGTAKELLDRIQKGEKVYLNI